VTCARCFGFSPKGSPGAPILVPPIQNEKPASSAHEAAISKDVFDRIKTYAGLKKNVEGSLPVLNSWTLFPNTVPALRLVRFASQHMGIGTTAQYAMAGTMNYLHEKFPSMSSSCWVTACTERTRPRTWKEM